MAKGHRLRVGDIVAIPLEGDQVAISQVVGSYKKETYYFAVFDQPCRMNDFACVEARLHDEISLLALSMDAKISAGHWPVLAHREVDIGRIPFPAYLEGVSPPGSFEVVDYSGERRRPAPSDVHDLVPRKVVAPVRIEKAVRALHGLEPWSDAYDDLRVPAETAQTNYWFADR